MVPRRPFTPRLVVDGLIVVLAVACAVGTALRDRPPGSADAWWQVPAVTLLVLALLARDRFPFVAPAALWLAAAALSFADGQLIANQSAVFVAGMGAALLLGQLRDSGQALAGLAIIIGGAVIVDGNKPGHTTSELVFTALLFAISWLAGRALRARAEQTAAAELRAQQAEREREVATRLAVAEERARIARELHDVVAHALSVMVLQVGAVRRRRTVDEAEDRDALLDVERVGRSALAEMRRLLAAMRAADDEAELSPQPGLADLDALVGEVRRTGLDVHVTVHGQQQPLPAVLDLSAYRIVQEGLTNTLKHAGAHRADVELDFRGDELLVEVRDDGTAERTGPSSGTPGLGLVGVRERVSILGGEVWAGPDAGGFLLKARLPYEPSPA